MLLRSSTQSTDGKFGKALAVNNQKGASYRYCREILQLTKLTAKTTKEIISSAQKANFSQYQNPSKTQTALY
jgi:hypothetical protein